MRAATAPGVLPSRGRVLVESLLFLLLAPTAAMARTPPAQCPPGRYLVEGAALVPGSDVDPDVVVLGEDGSVTIESGCAPVAGKRKATRKGTKVKAAWAAGACGPGVGGKARLAARTDATCQSLSGKLKAKKFKRKFSARLSRCGDGVHDPVEICPLLEFPADDPALDHLEDRYVLDGVAESEISDDPARGRIARTQLEIGFAQTATVGQINAALEGIDAAIIATLEHVLLIVVRIPDPGSLAALDALAAQLEADPVITSVRLAGFAEPAELPSNYPMPAPDLAKIDHHLAVRGAAAWNVRAALPVGLLAPLVVVGDFFGGGAPGLDFDVSDVDADYGTGAVNSHGYHVLGIIAGGFGGDASGAGLVTGAYPATLSVRAADYLNPGALTLTEPMHEDVMLVQAATGGSSPVVVNTSLQYDCSTPVRDAANCTVANARDGAMAWITKVRGSGFETVAGAGRENQFLHVTAAGNVSVAGQTNARVAGAFAAAKLLPGLVDSAGAAVPNLTNVLVVENARAGLSPLCLSSSSKRPGDLAAIGATVWSMTAATASAGDSSGTSMATPQVAGFAAFLWGLRPTLTPQQVIGILTGSDSSQDPLPAGNPGGGCDPTDASQRVLDAYAAVLAADTLGDAVVRRTLLDLDEDGGFDEQDVEAFLDAFAESFGTFDWSRHDLNGDGQTGGDTLASFDLDADDPPALETLSHDIGGTPRDFDETALRDLDVLCYYAWSGLYTGDPDERDLLLTIPCCADIEWVLTRIGNAAGDQGSFANAINDAGLVVGSDEDYVPFRWLPSEDDPTQGVRQALGLPANNERGSAEDVNAAGLIVGSTTDTGIPGVPGTGTQTAVVWTDGVPSAVGPAGQYSAASSINDAGMITGSTNGLGGWMLDGDTVHTLGGWGSAINNAGAIVGNADFPQFFVYGRPAFWPSPTSPAIYLGHFGGYGHATDVNDSGLIVGTARAPSLPLPFTSTGSGLAQLPTIPGGFHAQYGDAYGVNDNGEIVGSLWLENTDEVLGERAVRWIDGQAEDLNTLMSAADQASFVMAEALDINERGQIVGWGVELPFEQFTYHARAFLLTPHCGSGTP